MRSADTHLPRISQPWTGRFEDARDKGKQRRQQKEAFSLLTKKGNFIPTARDEEGSQQCCRMPTFIISTVAWYTSSANSKFALSQIYSRRSPTQDYETLHHSLFCYVVFTSAKRNKLINWLWRCFPLVHGFMIVKPHFIFTSSPFFNIRVFTAPMSYRTKTESKRPHKTFSGQYKWRTFNLVILLCSTEQLTGPSPLLAQWENKTCFWYIKSCPSYNVPLFNDIARRLPGVSLKKMRQHAAPAFKYKKSLAEESHYLAAYANPPCMHMHFLTCPHMPR